MLKLEAEFFKISIGTLHSLAHSKFTLILFASITEEENMP